MGLMRKINKMSKDIAYQLQLSYTTYLSSLFLTSNTLDKDTLPCLREHQAELYSRVTW
jgi:hypothetical protein